MGPKMTTMTRPETRVEFEERMHLYQEQMRLGLMHFAEGLDAEEDVLAVRTLPNGRVDLLSIDDSVRVQINTAYQMLNKDFLAMVKFPDERLSEDD